MGLKYQVCSRVGDDWHGRRHNRRNKVSQVEKETEAKMCGQILPTLGKFKYPEVVKQPSQFGGGLKRARSVSLTERRVGTGVGRRRYGGVAG